MTGMLASAFGSAGSYILSTQCSVVSQTQYSTIISPTSHPLCLTPTDPACFLCLQVVSVAPFGFAPLALHSSKFALGPGFSFICTARTPPFHCTPHFPAPHSLLMPSVFPALLSKPPVLSMLTLKRRESWVRWKVGMLAGLGELAGPLCRYSHHLLFPRKTS